MFSKMRYNENRLLLLQLITSTVAFMLPKGNVRLSPTDNFVRVIGSINPNDTIVTYINGTVYGKLGDQLLPLFWMEGYNINRKEPQKDGSYLTLSREFLVYREFKTRQILEVYENVFSQKPNEVFPISNDPVNGQIPAKTNVPMWNVTADILAYYDTNYILEYPNPMNPKDYPLFSAAEIYDAAELFTYYFKRSDIVDTRKSNVPNIVTWTRHCQFLPWMEMGQTSGSLFYAAFSWKCTNGLSCVAKDILDLISAKYPTFLSAPKTYEVPNETSWTVFKGIIDARRRQQLPDIIIPQVNITRNVSINDAYIDNRVQKVLLQSPYFLNFEAVVLTEIYGQVSEKLFGIKGSASIKTYRGPSSNNLQMYLYLNGTFLDPITNEPIKKWMTPILNVTVDVPEFTLYDNINLGKDNSYTTIIPVDETIGLTIAFGANSTREVHMINFIFNEMDLSEGNHNIFGTYHRFSGWFPWMKMGNWPGTVITKAIMG